MMFKYGYLTPFINLKIVCVILVIVLLIMKEQELKFASNEISGIRSI